jgi:hypothetical protein
MPILKNVQKPNGQLVMFHKVRTAELDYGQGFAMVQVSSWPTAESHDLGKPLDWHFPVKVAIADLGNVEQTLITMLESPYLGGTIVPDIVDSLDAWKLRKKAEVDVERDRRILLPFEYAGAMFDGDAKSQRNIQSWQTQIAAGVTLPLGFVWRDAGNVDHPADAAFVDGLGAALTARGTLVYQESWRMKAAIDAAETLDELVAVAWQF